MTNQNQADLKILEHVLSAFDIPGKLLNVETIKTGHINNTYRSTWENITGTVSSFIHQQINTSVFLDVPGLMQNIALICAHIENKIKTNAEISSDLAIKLVPCKTGLPYCVIESKDLPAKQYWRTYVNLSDTLSYDACKSAEQAQEAARACAKFHLYTADLSPDSLVETIPFFLHTPRRYQQLDLAIKQDVLARKAQVPDLIEASNYYSRYAALLVDAITEGKISTRVTHHDLKFNNILFDKSSNKAVAVCDLDTCMPGSLLYDFGSFVRNACTSAAEDEKDLNQVLINLGYFQAITVGYLEYAKPLLNKHELELLPQAALIMTLTDAVRFLTDYLNADVYYKTAYPEHNLDRARNQFALVASIEKELESMREIVSEGVK